MTVFLVFQLCLDHQNTNHMRERRVHQQYFRLIIKNRNSESLRDYSLSTDDSISICSSFICHIIVNMN